MAAGPPGIGNSVITPSVVMRPMLLPSVNHSAPSGPLVMLPAVKVLGLKPN